MDVKSGQGSDKSLGAIYTFVSVSYFLMLLVPPIYYFLVIRRPLIHVVPLFILALLLVFLLQLVYNKPRAVETTLWAISAYLLILALFVPNMIEKG